MKTTDATAVLGLVAGYGLLWVVERYPWWVEMLGAYSSALAAQSIGLGVMAASVLVLVLGPGSDEPADA